MKFCAELRQAPQTRFATKQFAQSMNYKASLRLKVIAGLPVGTQFDIEPDYTVRLADLIGFLQKLLKKAAMPASRKEIVIRARRMFASGPYLDGILATPRLIAYFAYTRVGANNTATEQAFWKGLDHQRIDRAHGENDPLPLFRELALPPMEKIRPHVEGIPPCLMEEQWSAEHGLFILNPHSSPLIDFTRN